MEKHLSHLNYNHLLYFWTVAKEGSIAKASETLHITPQTISGQIKVLESSIGAPLFHRSGRGLMLSETGRMVNVYAEEIFSLGSELTQTIKSNTVANTRELVVGIVDSIPKLVAYRTIAPCLALDDDIKIVCLEGDLENLLAQLSVHKIELVLSDRPVPSGLSVKAYNHLLGESKISFYAHRSIADRFTRDFPNSLNNAPTLLPLSSSPLRSSLDDWFEANNIAPKIVAEFDDSALLKAFGEAGIGIYPAPDAISDHIEKMYDAEKIGTLDSVIESYYAISPERKLKHPGVKQITKFARSNIFM
jgi:LysR family transcriptional activator of nhaA